MVLLPAPEGMSIAARNTAAIVLLMSVWWISGAIPIYMTALLPIALFPLLKILPASLTVMNYGHNYVLMFLAGFIIAKAIEVQGLHKRIALVIISAIGTDRRKLILSIMFATAFISMWISNVTSALLMLPIALSVILREEEFTGRKDNFSVALMLSVAYGASVGGVGTLIGSPTNLILVGVLGKLYPEAPVLTFFSWLKIGLPVMLIFLPVIWFYLVRYYHVSGSISKDSTVISDELHALGKMSSGEKRVMAVFLLAVFGWVFREDFVFGRMVIPGWATLLGLNDYVHDSTVAMLCAALMFMIPSDSKRRLIDWKEASQIPWGVVMIVGGGYAIADGFSSSGLADWLGGQLIFINSLPSFLVLLIILAFILFFTEVSSNTATVNIFLPVLASLAVVSGSNPLLLMIPATIAASFSFMMPAGTGPNTVIFASERITVSEMATCGLWLKFVSLVLLTLILYFIVMPWLNLDPSLPEWAR